MVFCGKKINVVPSWDDFPLHVTVYTRFTIINDVIMTSPSRLFIISTMAFDLAHENTRKTLLSIHHNP